MTVTVKDTVRITVKTTKGTITPEQLKELLEKMS